MKIIFLDIDGVLNCQRGYETARCKYKEIIPKEGEKDHYQEFFPPSKNLLNKLIKETGAKIVCSSSWRKSGLGFIRDVWREEGMSGEIIDVTPSLYLKHDGCIKFYNNKLYEHPTPEIKGYSIPRGCEIEYWLKDKGFYHCNWSKEVQEKVKEKSGIESYVILDDDSDMLYNQYKNFVCVEPAPRNIMGFNRFHYERALAILNK